MVDNQIEICLVKDAAEKSKICREILSALPQWFGIPEANAEYIRQVQSKIFFAAQVQQKVVGFYALEAHSASSAEIYLCAVLPQWQGQKIGTTLQKYVEHYLQEEGVKFLTVKTLSAQHPDQYYAKTRKFYQKMGFVVLQELPDLWGEDNPCLLMLKILEHYNRSTLLQE
ncbi:MAG: GNAT family N-acetyltransferase [Candidatus Cloacimonadales bacterium]